jgi:disulfide bond formation protein DsbB
MLGALGISVNVKMPKEIKMAAKELPNLTATGDRFSSSMDSMNMTMQVALATAFVALAVTGFVLIGREK